jgi:hypothetical protein
MALAGILLWIGVWENTILDEHNWSRSLSSIAPVASSFYLTPVEMVMLLGIIILTSMNLSFQPGGRRLFNLKECFN